MADGGLVRTFGGLRPRGASTPPRSFYGVSSWNPLALALAASALAVSAFVAAITGSLVNRPR